MKDIVVTGFSGGSGKTFFVKKFLSFIPERYEFSISHTSRCRRGGEKNGKEYHFVTPSEFESMIVSGKFLEWNEPRKGEYYGTTIAEYNRIRESGKGAIFDVDFKGVQQLKEKQLPLFVLALLPKVWTRRCWMLQRGDMSGADIKRRIIFSEKIEKPFFRKKSNNHLFDLKIKKYNAGIDLDILLNTVANGALHPPTL